MAYHSSVPPPPNPASATWRTSLKLGVVSKTATIAFVTHPDAEQRKNLLAEATARQGHCCGSEEAQRRSSCETHSCSGEGRRNRTRTCAGGYGGVFAIPVRQETSTEDSRAHGEIKEGMQMPFFFGGGFHKDKCSLHPINLKGTLTRHLQNRENIEQQLMKRISLSAPQRESALQHLFGPSSKASGSGTRGARTDVL